MSTPIFGKLLRTSAATYFGLICATSVSAQETSLSAASEVEENDAIVVTGLRESLDQARSIKRNNDQFVDAVVAEDIGKLPDTNVAESLARVSGVQVDRGIGAGTSVSIRGLRENVTLYNGREVFDAVGRGGTGLDQTLTSTYGLLALVPAEVISRLEVTKLASAQQIAGGLGGIIDIVSRKPGKNTQIATSVGVSYETLPKKAGLELFGLFSTRDASDTLGFLVSAAYTKRNLAEHGLNTIGGYSRFTNGGRTRFGLSDYRAQQIVEERETLGLSGVVEWAPSDSFKLIADTFYSRLTADRERRWIAFNPTAALTNPTFSPGDILLSGNVVGGLNTNTEFQDNKSNLWTSALRAELRPSDVFEGSFEISMGDSSADLARQFVRLTTRNSTPTIAFDLSAGPFGSASIAGVDLNNPAQLNFAILFDDLFRAQTDDLQVRTDWTLRLEGGFLDSLQFGVRMVDLETNLNPLRADIRPGLGADQFTPQFFGSFRNDRFLSGQLPGLPRSFLSALKDGATGCGAFTSFPSISQNAQCLDRTISPNSIGSTFLVQEDFTNFYSQMNFDTALGGAGVSGNIGVRYVGRDLTSTGNLINPAGAVSLVTFRRTDSHWLPSAVAKLTLTDELILRFGAAKVLSYPKTEDLNNGVVLFNNAVFDAQGNQTSPGTGRGGAPNLNPFEATQYDASVEYYFGDSALLSAGLFYKDIATFIIEQSSAENFGGVNFLISRKVNGNKATVKGLELLYQQPLTFLPSPFDGLGVMATYSYIDSKTPITDAAGRNLTFPGLSKHNVNAVVYYEKGPFSARVAYNWRDQYLRNLNAVTNTGVYNDSYSDLSAFLGFDFTDNLSLEFEAANLLNSEQRTYDGTQEALRTNVIFGRIFKASVRVRF